MAYTVDAVLADLPPLFRCGSRNRGGGEIVRRALEQPRRAGRVCFEFTGVGGHGDLCESRAESSAKDLVSIEGDIPDDIETARLDSKSPPSAWYRTRDESLRRFGDAWIDAEQTVALALPSAAVRGEWNILLNPTHRDFEKVKFGEPEPFNFDPRMFR